MFENYLKILSAPSWKKYFVTFITQKCRRLKLMNWYLRTLTPAEELKSWLRWHLPPILRVLPHKQIKQLYLFLSPLHFTPMTLHLHLSFVSLPSHTSSLTASRLSFICKYLWGKEGEEMLSSFWKTNSLTILQASLFSIWLDMAFRETTACCLQSWVEGWQRQWAHSGGWWGEGTTDSTRMELCREGYWGQNKSKLHLHWTSGKRMLRVLFHSIPLYLNKRFNKIITGSL